MLAVVLNRVPLPNNFPRQAEITYSSELEQAVVRFQLPGREVVPTVRGYKYVQTQDKTQATTRPVKEIGEMYRSLVAQVALRCCGTCSMPIHI